jgi:aryl-alcohol dehydrogenase-like predicted oxidoreductase
MRLISFAPLARKVSALGFGCASLGSRVDDRRGVEALGRAYNAGVTWFDVAPSYGDGRAEALLGKFLLGKRSQVIICTKVGILPGRLSVPMRIVRPLLRGATRLLPGLREQVVRFRPQAQRARLTGSFIESSITESLRRLNVNYVDILALHEPEEDDLQREDIAQALDNVVRKGYARAISCAGNPSVAISAVALLPRVNIVQFRNSLSEPNIAALRAKLSPGRSVGLVTHGVYGHQGSLNALTKLFSSDTDRRALVALVGYRGNSQEVAADLLLDFALASNLDGVVLLSMFMPQHLRHSLSRLSASPPADIVLELTTRLSSVPALRRFDRFV